MKLLLLITFFLTALLGGTRCLGQDDDPFGPQKEPSREKAKGGDSKVKSTIDRLTKIARRVVDDDFMGLGGGPYQDGRYGISTEFLNKAAPAEDLQEILLDLASELYRSRVPLSELKITVKSRRDAMGGNKGDPDDRVCVKLNLDAAKVAKWQSRKTLDFKALFTVIRIHPDLLGQKPEAWPPVTAE